MVSEHLVTRPLTLCERCTCFRLLSLKHHSFNFICRQINLLKHHYWATRVKRNGEGKKRKRETERTSTKLIIDSGGHLPSSWWITFILWKTGACRYQNKKLYHLMGVFGLVFWGNTLNHWGMMAEPDERKGTKIIGMLEGNQNGNWCWIRVDDVNLAGVIIFNARNAIKNNNNNNNYKNTWTIDELLCQEDTTRKGKTLTVLHSSLDVRFN